MNLTAIHYTTSCAVKRSAYFGGSDRFFIFLSTTTCTVSPSHNSAPSSTRSTLYPNRITAPPRRQQRRPHHQLIVIPGRRTIPHMRIHHRNPAAFLSLHPLVVQPHAPHQLNPANLKPHQIVRVIHHAHLVRLGIPHAQTCLSTYQLHYSDINFTHPASLPNPRPNIEKKPTADQRGKPRINCGSSIEDAD
jgi:hypothetical protein